MHYHLVGIKGVAMTALAGILTDAGHQVTGSDVAENFVTAKVLASLPIAPQIGFAKSNLPAATQAVVFSGAHGGSSNPQVVAAKKLGLPVFSHMQFLATLFNHKQGLAVCGVGGKSTISAMLAFVLEQIDPQSYSVGVGEILGLPATGKYRQNQPLFIVEADEYVADPSVKNQPIIPRMSFLQPETIICANLKFDHPDVYENFAHTKSVYADFFLSLKGNGKLIYSLDDANLAKLCQQVKQKRPDITLISFSRCHPGSNYTLADLKIDLQVPGEFNRLNALAALAALESYGYKRSKILLALAKYRSVKRRLELIKSKNGIVYWDDYAHHPSEISAAIAAIVSKYPGQKLTVAFQPHTYSRTKSLLTEFAHSLAGNWQTLLVDIFPSARESADPSINAEMLVAQINQLHAGPPAINVHNNQQLATYLRANLRANEVFLSLGAGDIYLVHQQL